MMRVPFMRIFVVDSVTWKPFRNEVSDESLRKRALKILEKIPRYIDAYSKIMRDDVVAFMIIGKQKLA